MNSSIGHNNVVGLPVSSPWRDRRLPPTRRLRVIWFYRAQQRPDCGEQSRKVRPEKKDGNTHRRSQALRRRRRRRATLVVYLRRRCRRRLTAKWTESSLFSDPWRRKTMGWDGELSWWGERWLAGARLTWNDKPISLHFPRSPGLGVRN